MPTSRRDDELRQANNAGGYGYPIPEDHARHLRLAGVLVRVGVVTMILVAVLLAVLSLGGVR